MKTTLSVFTLLASLVLSAPLTPVRAAEEVLADDFAGPLSTKTWKSTPGVKTEDGSLLMQTAPGSSDRDRAEGTIFTDTRRKLDFTHTPVTMELDSLDIQGSADRPNSVFMLFLADDKNTSRSNYTLQLRIDAEGKIVLMLYYLEPGQEVQKRRQLVLFPVALPVKKAKLNLNPKSGSLTVETAAGEQTRSFDWNGTIRPDERENPEIYLMLRAVTKADPGTTGVKLGGINIKTGE
jgi:hypothetical protein